MSDDRLTDLLTRALDQAVEGVAVPPATVVPLQRHRSPWLAPLASAAAVAVVVLGGVALLGGQPSSDDSVGPAATAPPLGSVDPALNKAKTVFIVQPVPRDLRAGVKDCLDSSGATRTRAGEPDFDFYTVPEGQGTALTACLGEAVGLSSFGLLDKDRGVITRPEPERYTEGNLRSPRSRVVPGTLRDTSLPGVQAWLAESQDGLEVCFGRITTGENGCGSGAVRYSSISPQTPGTLIAGPVPTKATAGSVRLAIPGPRGVRHASLPAVVVRFDQLPDVALVIAEWPGVAQEVRGRTGMEFVPQPE